MCTSLGVDPKLVCIFIWTNQNSIEMLRLWNSSEPSISQLGSQIEDKNGNIQKLCPILWSCNLQFRPNLKMGTYRLNELAINRCCRYWDVNIKCMTLQKKSTQGTITAIISLSLWWSFTEDIYPRKVNPRMKSDNLFNHIKVHLDYQGINCFTAEMIPGNTSLPVSTNVPITALVM